MPKSNKLDEITLVLVVALIAMGISIYDKINDKLSSPEMEAEKITEMILDKHEISFADGGVIDENKLKQIQSMGYDELKNYLNAKNDFCIYIEDENGNIILAKGSNKLNGDGLSCKE